jgi:hypothetical protein
MFNNSVIGSVLAVRCSSKIHILILLVFHWSSLHKFQEGHLPSIMRGERWSTVGMVINDLVSLSCLNQH